MSFFYKLKHSKDASKTMQPSSSLRLAAGIDAFFAVALHSNTSAHSIHGSVFNLQKQ